MGISSERESADLFAFISMTFYQYFGLSKVHTPCFGTRTTIQEMRIKGNVSQDFLDHGEFRSLEGALTQEEPTKYSKDETTLGVLKTLQCCNAH